MRIIGLSLAVMTSLFSIPALAVDLFEDSKIEASSLATKTLERLDKLQSKALHHQITLRKFSSTLIRFESPEQMANDYPTLEVKVENGQRLTARFVRVLVQDIGFLSWVGRVEGDLYSTAIFTEKDGYLAGEISAFGSTYSIKPLDRELTALRKLDFSKATSTAEDVIFKERPSQANGAETEVTNGEASLTEPNSVHQLDLDSSVENDGSVIDIYVFYSDDAAAASASVTTEIANDLAFTNTALDNSCTQTSLRLVGTSQLTFDESSRQGDDYLSWLSQIKDGQYDTIYDTLRVSGADMIQLWVEDTLGSSANSSAVGTVAGIAYAAVPHPAWGSTFSVKVRSTSAFTTAHEIGHNFSIWHDRYQCSGIKLQTNYPVETGFGFVNLNEKVRDIMSYDTECNVHATTCTQIPYFSNPRIFVQGQPFGVPNQADAAFRIYKNRKHVARIRPATTTPTAPTFAGCMETQASSMKLDKCFIATAAFGSFLDPHVTTFRKFRDGTLATSEIGRFLIEFYYEHSPRLATWIEGSPMAKSFSRAVLSILLFALLDPMAVAGVLGAVLLSLVVIFFGRKRSRAKSLTSIYLPAIVGLVFAAHSPVASASYNSPSLFSDARMRNPASLQSTQPVLETSLLAKMTDGKYFSIDQSSTEVSNAVSPVVELKYGTPDWNLWAAIEPQAKVTYRWMRTSDGDEWEVSKKNYQAATNLTLWQGMIIGLGFRKATSSMVRPPSNPDGNWGVFETQHVEDIMGGSAGLRWIAFEQLSLASHIEYDQKIASDTAKLGIVRGAMSVGYFGLADGFLNKFDVTYLAIPQSVAYEAAPYANGFQAQTIGFNIDSEVKFPLGHLGLETIFLGYEYEVLTRHGFDSSGSKALQAIQRLKFGSMIWQNTAKVSGYTQSTTIEHGVMTETATEMALAFSMYF